MVLDNLALFKTIIGSEIISAFLIIYQIFFKDIA